MDDKFRRLIYVARLEDGETTHYGESLLLAMLLHTKGNGRNSSDMADVQRIMRDINYDGPDSKV